MSKKASFGAAIGLLSKSKRGASSKVRKSYKRHLKKRHGLMGGKLA